MNNRRRQIKRARRDMVYGRYPVRELIMGIDWDAFRRALDEGIKALKALAQSVGEYVNKEEEK